MEKKKNQPCNHRISSSSLGKGCGGTLYEKPRYGARTYISSHNTSNIVFEMLKTSSINVFFLHLKDTRCYLRMYAGLTCV